MRLCVLLYSLFLPLYSFCQPPGAAQYSIIHYTDENGLPQNSVKSIFQDRDGFVWLTTESGLVRFDGLHFKVFDKANTPVSSSRFSYLLPDHRLGGKCFFASTEGFESLRIQAGNATPDSTYSRSLQKTVDFTPHKDLLYTGAPRFAWDSALQKGSARYVIISPRMNGISHIVYNDRIAFYKSGKRIGKTPYKNYRYPELFTLNDELYHWQPDGKIRRITPSGPLPVSVSGDFQEKRNGTEASGRTTVFSNHLSDQSFITKGKKLFALKRAPDGNLETRLLIDGFDFRGNGIEKILVDEATGRIFLGSLSKGLFVFSHKAFRTIAVDPGGGDNVVYAHSLVKNNLFMVSGGRLLKLPVDTTNMKTAFRAWAQTPTQNLDEITIAADSSGRLWASSGYALLLFDPSGAKLLENWKMNDLITTMSMENGHKLWLGTRGGGIWLMDTQRPGSKPMPFALKGFAKITNILPGPDSLFIGTNRGLFLLNRFSRKAKRVTGTENTTIRGLYHTTYKGRRYLFISTYGDGIMMYHKHRLFRYPVDARKSLLFAHCFVEDGRGFLWIPTNTGLIQASKGDLINYIASPGPGQPPFYLHYGKRHGFSSNEFNGACVPCGVTLPDHTISLPSMEGLVWFKPGEVKAELPDKAIFIDKVSVFGKPVSVKGGVVNLPTQPRQVSIQLSTPYFGDAINLKMSYAVVEADKIPADSAWIDVGPANIITFSELQSGDYTLLIRKANGFGLSNVYRKTLLLKVPPVWHETIWFYAGCIVLGILAGLVYSRARGNYLEQKNADLEEKIMLRTSNLQGTLAALERSEHKLNRQTFIQTRLIASISHDIRNPLRYLSTLIGAIERLVKARNLERVQEICADLIVSSERMANILDNHLEYAKSIITNNHETETTRLSDIVHEKKELFLPYLKQRGNLLVNWVDKDLTVQTDPDLLKVIIHNLIDNANKHTTNGTIRAFAGLEDDAVTFSVIDDGPGFPLEVLDWINLPDSPETDLTIARQKYHYNGLGLVIIKDLCTMLGIGLTARNDGGAQLTLRFKGSE